MWSSLATVPIDGVMEGGTVAKVEASNHPDYAAGDYVVGRAGWQEFAVSNGEGPLLIAAGAGTALALGFCVGGVAIVFFLPGL